MCLYFFNKVKVTHQGEGHIMVKVKYLYPSQFYVAHTVKQAGGLHSTEMGICYTIFWLILVLRFPIWDMYLWFNENKIWFHLG